MEYRVKTGDIIDVTITGIQPYGAFASLSLIHTFWFIHISEISDKFVRSVESFVHVGEVIRVKVIDIDEESHQAKLSLKAVHTAKRKYKRAYKNQREKIQETPLGFNPLKEKLPEWIAQGIKKEEE